MKQDNNGKRPKRRRPTYRQHADDEIQKAIQIALGGPTGDIFRDWLEEEIMKPSFANTNPAEMAFNEGRRDLAREIINLSMNIAETKVEMTED